MMKVYVDKILTVLFADYIVANTKRRIYSAVDWLNEHKLRLWSGLFVCDLVKRTIRQTFVQTCSNNFKVKSEIIYVYELF